jgi:hypothetical protein
MSRKLLATLAVGVVVVAAAVPVASAAPQAGGPPQTCAAGLTIFTTSVGAVRTTGQVTHFDGSGVAGQYTSGFLAGYTLSGAQDIVVNNVNQTSELHGQFTAVGPGGTLSVRYNGQADLATGAATGELVSTDGTGVFAGFHWTAKITAQLVSLTPPTFLATDSGPCKTS